MKTLTEKFNVALQDLNDVHSQVQAMLSKEELDEDNKNWFNPKIECFQDVLFETEMWLKDQVDQNPVERNIGTQL